jgi:hypothetical protein
MVEGTGLETFGRQNITFALVSPGPAVLKAALRFACCPWVASLPTKGLLSRDSQSSEQFAGLNRRYDEMQAEFARVSLTISETSQEEAL